MILSINTDVNVTTMLGNTANDTLDISYSSVNVATAIQGFERLKISTGASLNIAGTADFSTTSLDLYLTDKDLLNELLVEQLSSGYGVTVELYLPDNKLKAEVTTTALFNS